MSSSAQVTPPKLRLLLVRHGQSEYNAALRDPCTYLSPMFWRHAFCPGIRDARLTPKGRDQARKAASVLKREIGAVSTARVNGEQQVHFLTSPLTRAVETALLMMQGTSKTQQQSFDLLALPVLRERMATFSDCGRTVDTLRTEFKNYLFDMNSDRNTKLPLNTTVSDKTNFNNSDKIGNTVDPNSVNIIESDGQQYSGSAKNENDYNDKEKIKQSESALDSMAAKLDFSILDAESASTKFWWLANADPHSSNENWRPGFGSIESSDMIQTRVKITKRFLLRRYGSSNLNYEINATDSQSDVNDKNPASKIDDQAQVEKFKNDSESEPPLIVLFGHSMFWMEFLAGRPITWFDRIRGIKPPKKLKNCGMAYCELNSDMSVKNIQYIDS